MKQKSLLVSTLVALLAIILFAMVGCGPVHYSYRPHYRQPRTYVQFDHFWFNNRPFIQPRVIVVQPRQPRQPIRRGKR
jgi:uncharacterized membrane protein